jgi:hypothetical protein
MAKAQLVNGKLVIDKDKNDVSSEGEAKEGEATSSALVSKSEKKKRFKVMINQQDSFDGKYDVPLGVNGVVHQIKRGVEVILDEDYLQVLKDSIIDQVVQDGEGNDEIVKIARYSFSVLGEVA